MKASSLFEEERSARLARVTKGVTFYDCSCVCKTEVLYVVNWLRSVGKSVGQSLTKGVGRWLTDLTQLS